MLAILWVGKFWSEASLLGFSKLSKELPLEGESSGISSQGVSILHKDSSTMSSREVANDVSSLRVKILGFLLVVRGKE